MKRAETYCNMSKRMSAKDVYLAYSKFCPVTATGETISEAFCDMALTLGNRALNDPVVFHIVLWFDTKMLEKQ